MFGILLIVCLSIALVLPFAVALIAKLLGRDQPDKRPSVIQSVICVVLWVAGIVFLATMNVYGGIHYYEDTVGASGNVFYMYWFVSVFIVLVSGIALWSAIFDKPEEKDAKQESPATV